jgi:hypothetical protein
VDRVKRVRPDFSVLSGWEDLILPSLLAGADGSICAFANVAPELFVNLVRYARDDNLQRATELHRPDGCLLFGFRALGLDEIHDAANVRWSPSSRDQSSLPKIT